ncbi:MAG: PKD domain-containing protein, partial [Bacteroidales bacterium]
MVHNKPVLTPCITQGFAQTWPVPGRRHIIMAGPGTYDPYTCNNLITVFPGDAYSARLGDTSQGGNAEQLKYQINVTNSKYLFIYRYAAVLESPNHSYDEQPGFEVTVEDTSGTIIDSVCGFYHIYAPPCTDPPNCPVLGGWNYCPNVGYQNDGCYWKNWTTVGMNLSNYAGQTIQVVFTTHGCAYQVHRGYAYISASCGSLSIEVAMCRQADSSLTLTAPPGFAHYQWSNGDTVQQIVMHNPPEGDTISCILTALNGCTDTIRETIKYTRITTNFYHDSACSGTSMQFYDSSYVNQNAVTGWIWNFGDGTPLVNGVQNPLHIFALPGIYNVKLVSFSTEGCKDSITKQVTIDASISINTQPSDRSLCEGLNTSFEISATGTGLTYSWQVNSGTGWTNLSDGGVYSGTTTDSLILTGVTAGMNGYKYRCILNGSCPPAQTSNSVTLTVFPTPTVIATPPVQAICSGGTTGIILTSSTPTTIFTWSVSIVPFGSVTGALAGSGDAIVQTLVNGTTNSAQVTYTIVPTANGCTGTPIQVIVTVNPIPAVTATPVFQTICSNESCDINLLSLTSNTNFSWTFLVSPPGSITGAANGTGNNISQNLINTNTSPGMVTYTIVPTANGCTGLPINATVTVNPLPVPVITGPTTVCFNTAHLYSTNVGMTNYNWSVTGGTITSGAGTNSITVIWNSGGVQSLSVTFTDANGCNPATPPSLNVTVNQIIVTIAGINVTCFGANDGSAFANVSGGTAPYSFQWNDPLSQTTNPAINLLPGTYTVTVTDAASCSTTQSITLIQEYPTPSANISIDSTDKVCSGNSINLRFDLTGTPPWSLTYSDGTNSTTVNGIMSSPYIVQVYPAQSCIYTITSLTDAHCTAVPGMIAGSAGITVFPLPAVEFTWEFGGQNNAVQFHIDSSITDLGAIGYMVLWNFGDGTFGYGHNPLHIYGAANQFDVTLTLTDTNGCKNSITHLVDVTETPHAFFSSTAPNCKGQPVCFTDLSFLPAPPLYIKTWIWDFGDGSPEDTIHFPNNPNVCHTYYDTLTNYPVTLTIIASNDYNDHYTSNVEIVPNPIAAFTHSEACQSQNVQFNDSSLVNGSVSIISWNWDFGDPGSGIYNLSQLRNPQHIYGTGGQYYSVRLIISNLNGCKDTATKSIWVRPSPPVEFLHDSACNGQIVTYMADTVITHIDSIVSWSWDFGDG